jgi:hypothetical protein
MIIRMLAKHSVLERVLRPAEGDVPVEFARKLLGLDFEPGDHARYRELSARSQVGALTPDEQVELDDLLTTNDVLMILRAKARISLKRASPAA